MPLLQSDAQQHDDEQVDHIGEVASRSAPPAPPQRDYRSEPRPPSPDPQDGSFENRCRNFCCCVWCWPKSWFSRKPKSTEAEPEPPVRGVETTHIGHPDHPSTNDMRELNGHGNGVDPRRPPNLTVNGRVWGGQTNGTMLPNGNGHLTNGHVQVEDRRDSQFPSYYVEHLATFGMSKTSGPDWAVEGIRKLRQMERSSAIWAQPMILILRPDTIVVEDENGEVIESFPVNLVSDPTAHILSDSRDLYNNILLFAVREDAKRTGAGPEMHIFQCVRKSANEVADDMKNLIQGGFESIRPRRLTNGIQESSRPPQLNGGGPPREYPSPAPRPPSSNLGGRYGPDVDYGPPQPVPFAGGFRATWRERDDFSDTSDSFERDVNTLNKCFDEIERFVARIQQAAIAQRELESRRTRGVRRGHGDGMLQSRAQMPSEREFIDVLQKFKLSFNLLAKLRNHIHEPNAPELLHFLFTPLTVILDACRWGLGENIAPRVVSPLVTRDTKNLMLHCLTSKEADVWLALGDAWRIPEEEWPHALPPPYYPIFYDNTAPYGYPPDVNGFAPQPRNLDLPVMQGRRHGPAASEIGGPRSFTPTYQQQPLQRHGSHGNINNVSIEFEKLELEKKRLQFEKEKLTEKERALQQDKEKIEAERRRLSSERKRFYDEQDKKSENSFGSERPLTIPVQREVGHRSNGGGRVVEDRDATDSSVVFERLRRRNVQEEHHVNERIVPFSIDTSNNGFSTSVNGVLPTPQKSLPVTNSNSAEQSPRQQAFLDDLLARRVKAVQVTHDRQANNAKELTVSKAEFLEVLNDTKQWWECRNIHNRIGFVPNTILQTVTGQTTGGSSYNSQLPSTSSGVSNHLDRRDVPPQNVKRVNGAVNHNVQQQQQQIDDDTPEYIRQRQGKRGEFRYF